MNSKKFIIAITPAMAIMIALLFMIMPAAGAVQAQPAVASTVQPNIALNTQATWNTFNSSMAYNQYINATGGTSYLKVANGSGNFISVVPGNIQSKDLQGENITTVGPWDSTVWALGSTVGAVEIAGKSGTSEYLSITENATVAEGPSIYYKIPVSDLISSSPAFNYLTLQYKLSGPAQTGTYSNIALGNGTVSYVFGTITPGQSGYFSLSLAQIQKMSGNTVSFNTTGSNAAADLGITAGIHTDAGTNTYNLSVLGMALTTYPVELGYNSTGSAVTQAYGTAYMNVFKPGFPMTVINSGYTENLTQPMNITTDYKETQTPLSGNYIEQVEYTGTLGNITAPEITFTGANITINQDIPSKQIQVLEINGISYINSMNTTGSNKTIMLTVANPGASYTIIDITDYTSTQWQSIASPAGFFQDPTAWIEGGIFSALIVVVVFLGFKGLGKTLTGEKANEENHTRILNGKKGR